MVISRGLISGLLTTRGYGAIALGILNKVSDYSSLTVEYFIEKIENELSYRDIYELTNGKIEKLNITKQHPLVSLISSQINNGRTDFSGLLPTISVTIKSKDPQKYITIGKSYKNQIIDDDFINGLSEYSTKTNKEIQETELVTSNQIDNIIDLYSRLQPGQMKMQINQWESEEKLSLSVWSESQDITFLLKNLVSSMLVFIQTGFLGDNSLVRNFNFSETSGLTNFNFGRVLHGTEFNLTFLNTYSNYTIYTDAIVSGHDFVGTFNVV